MMRLRKPVFRCCFRFLPLLLIIGGINGMSEGRFARGEDADELTQLLPADINAIAIVRVEEVLQSTLAQKGEWARKFDEKFMSGAGGIPSWVQTLVVGFLVRPAIPEEVWAAGVASVPDKVSIQNISEQNGVPIEKLNHLDSIHGRRNSYILGIAPGKLGVWRPSTRQEAARWARNIEAKLTGPISDYLIDIEETPGDLVMAIDLSDMLDPVNLRAILKDNTAMGKTPEERQQLLTLLLSLRGATFSAQVEEKTTAQLRIDFQNDVGQLGETVKSFFLDVLNQMGAAIDEFGKSQTTTQGKSIVLSTDLSDESLRRIVSLITWSPSSRVAENIPAPPAPDSPTGTPTERESTQAKASKKYYQQVDRFLTDLEKSSRRSNNIARTALWHQKFADKIDELPTQGVDPALIAFGSDIASKLRALSRSLQGQAVEVNAQQGTLTYDYNYNPGWASINVWGGVGYGEPSYRVTSNLQQVREKQAAAISAGAKQRIEVWGMMKDEQNEVLKEMKKKFGNNFPH